MLPIRAGVSFISGKDSIDLQFSLNLTAVYAAEPEALKTGAERKVSLGPETGMARTFFVDVPKGTDVLNININKSSSDLDLFVGKNSKYVTRKNAIYKSESPAGSERISISEDSVIPLTQGRYIITVADQSQEEVSADFSIVAYLSKEPPQSIARPADFPWISSGLDRAVGATVQVIGESISGSGCIVSDKGYAITAWHVVKTIQDCLQKELL